MEPGEALCQPTASRGYSPRSTANPLRFVEQQATRWVALRSKRTWHFVGLPVIEDSHTPFLWLDLVCIISVRRAP